MIAVYAASAALLIAAAALGHVICSPGGSGRPGDAGPAWAPAVGLAVLLVVARVGIELPGRATTAAVLVCVASVGVLAVPRARAALRAQPLDRLVVAGAALLVASLPFLTTGHVGILGVGDNNDMSAHLTAAWWLDTHGTPEPLSALRHSLIDEGYPLGPHALAAALSRTTGFSLVHGFAVLMLVAPALTAVAALGAVPAQAPRLARWVAAGLVGLAYLPVSYLTQGAFKETLLALLAVAFALALRDALRDERPRVPTGIALGVLAAATAYVYSVPGLLWPLGTAAVLLVLELVRRRSLRWVSGTLAVAVAAAATCAGLVALEAGHIADFLSSSFAAEPAEGLGNLHAPIPLAEVTGIWWRADFRFHAHPFGLVVALDLVAAIALVGAIVWWLRRRDLAVVSALAGAGLVALWSHQTRSPYNTAKSLAVLAPLVALTLFPPLAASRRVGIRVVGVVLALAAAASSFVALRDAPVGPRDHENELRTLAAVVGDRRVLYLNADDFTQWELRGTHAATTPLLYTPAIVPRWPNKPPADGAEVDFDSFASPTLDRFDFVITSGAAYQSSAPPNFRLVRRTPSLRLWRREGATPDRRIIERANAPGGILDCTSPAGRDVLAGDGVALVAARPLVGSPDGWRGQPREKGDTGSQTFQLPAGRWDVSLQYVSRTPLEIRAPGLDARVPANLERLSSFWAGGTLEHARSGPVTIRVTAGRPSRLGRVLGAPARTRALGRRRHQPLGRIALTRSDVRPRSVPLRQACGRYVDSYRPAG